MTHDPSQRSYIFRDPNVELTTSAADDTTTSVRPLRSLNSQHRLDMWIYHTFRHLLHGVLDRRQINQINSGAQ
jgi:hypothetical protein